MNAVNSEGIFFLIALMAVGVIIIWLVRLFLNAQYQKDYLAHANSKKGETLGIRLQAYERLLLLCERMSIDQMLLRTNHSDLDRVAIKNLLILTAQKEFEHNLTQQIYVSRSLWQMICLLRDQTIDLIQKANIESERLSKDVFIKTLLSASDQMSGSMGQKVKDAIHKEVALQFD